MIKSKEELYQCERKEMERLKKIQLPNSFKKIGSAIAIMALIMLFVNKYAMGHIEELRTPLKSLMIIGLLIVTLSKEKIEDELIKAIRLTSLAYATFIAIFYAVVFPYIRYLLDLLFAKEAMVENTKGSIVVMILLLCQTLYFYTLKKIHSEE